MKKLILLAAIFSIGIAVQAQDYIQIHVDTPTQNYIIDATLGADHIEFPNPVSGELAIANDGVSGPADNDTWNVEGSYCCDSIINGEDINGKVALISRGSCSFWEKITFAWAEGATAAIVWNRAPLGIMVGTHVDGLITMTLAGIDLELIDIPGYFISHEDGLLLTRLMDEGPVDITFDTPSMYDAVGPHAYATPVDQIRPLDAISVATFTRDLDTLNNVTFTCVITDPGSISTTLTTEVAELFPGKDAGGNVLEPIVDFDSYTPSLPGLYSMIFSAATTEGDHALDNTVITKEFEITSNTFANENADITDLNGIKTSEQIYTDIGDGLANYGAFFHTAAAGTATHVSFAIANPSEITENGTYDFNIKVFDADPDNSGQVNPLFYENDELSEATYEMSSDVGANQIVSVILETPVLLEADKIYAVYIDAGASFEFSDNMPAYSNAGGGEYPVENTFMYIGTGEEPIAEPDGWETWNDDATIGFARAGVHPIIRLHTAGFVGLNEIVALSDESFDIGPNPAVDMLYLNFDLDQQSDVLYSITDVLGKQVTNGAISNAHNTRHTLDISDLTAGTYVMRVQTDLGDATRKFVVLTD